MRRSLIGTCLVMGVTFLALSAWSGSARAGAGTAGSAANVESLLGGPEPPVIQDDALDSGKTVRLPAEPPTATPPLDGVLEPARRPSVNLNSTGKGPGGMSLLGEV